MEALIDTACRHFQIKRHRDRHRSPYRIRNLIAFCTQPLEQDIAAERETHHVNRTRRKLLRQPIHNPGKIGRLSGMVKAFLPVDLSAARPEVHRNRLPTDAIQLKKETEYIFTPGGSFETVE